MSPTGNNSKGLYISSDIRLQPKKRQRRATTSLGGGAQVPLHSKQLTIINMFNTLNNSKTRAKEGNQTDSGRPYFPPHFSNLVVIWTVEILISIT